MPHCPRPTPRGFTLVELMVVVTVTALLAVLAWPSARAALLRSHRSDATAALLCLQLAQERHRAARGHYAADLVQLPRCGTSSADGHYRLSLVAGGPDQYLASATAVGPQAGDSGCERLTLRVDGAITEQQPAARCWLR